MQSFSQDLKYALRMLRNNPGFTAVAITTLALAIGVNTAIFSVVNAVLLRPPPYAEADQLVMVWGNFLKLNMERLPAKAAEYEDYSAQKQTFETVAAYDNQNFNLIIDNQPQRITAARITPNLLSLLKIPAAEGRLFTGDDSGPGRDNVAILSHPFKQKHFGDRSIINQIVTLDDRSYTIIGVMPDGFAFPYTGPATHEPADVFVPLSFSAEQIARRQGPHYLNVIARLNADVSLAEARSQMNAFAQRLEREERGYRGPNGEDGGWRVTVVPLHEESVGGSRRGLLVLLAGVGLVLLIACANVGNLLLLRALKRRKELAIRTALGASRRRLIQQLAIEGLLLVTLSGVFGLLLARWGIDLLATLGAANLPRPTEIKIDRSVLAFTALTGIVSGVLLCLLPSLHFSRFDLKVALRATGELINSRPNRWSSVLVVVEVALSLLLLVGAGLLVNSFLHLQRVHPGLTIDHLMMAEINLPAVHYKEPAKVSGFYQELVHRIESLPGVKSASFTTLQPLSGGVQNDPFVIEGRPLNPTDLTSATWQVVGPGYFQTLGIPLIRGRDINATDSDSAAPAVAVVNQRMAARYWPNEDPIGRRVTLGLPRPGNPWITIVGVAKDVPPRLDSRPEPNWYLSPGVSPQLDRFMLVRTDRNISELANEIRTTVQSVDRNQAVTSIQTMTDVVDRTIAPRKFNTFVLTVFAALALGLAALGTYSVISYTVALRTQELAIRMALGAGKPNIMKLVLKRGMAPALIGTILGTVGALALSRLLASLLFEVSSTDPLTYISVAVFSLSVALLACYLPARRATRVDPLVALRYE
jgi:putative ABC transport system permease protein